MPSIRAFAAPAVIAAALALGACGDDDKDTTAASTPATTQAATTDTASTTETTSSGGGKYTAEDIQAEAEKLSTKWTQKSQELTSSITADPKSAKSKIGPFVDEFEKDYDALLDKVKNSDAPESVKTAIEQQKETLSKAFDTLKTQLQQLPG